MSKLKKLLLITILIVSATGTLSHFIYDASHGKSLIGIFVPVSESTWEHMKMIFFPMLIASFVLYNKLKSSYKYLGLSLSASILCGTFSIAILFYTYKGILGYDIMAVDISIFYISIIIGYFLLYKLLVKLNQPCISHMDMNGQIIDGDSQPLTNKKIFLCVIAVFMIIIVFLLTIAFWCYTYNAPDLGIFREP